jgi:hypothetical protein
MWFRRIRHCSEHLALLRLFRKRTGCTVLTEATLGVYGRLGRWMRRED